MAKAVSSKDKSVGKTAAKGSKPSGSRVAAARQAAVAKSGRSRVPAKGKAKTVEKKPRGKFLRDVRSEMGKVNWPTRTDLIQSTIVVLVAVAVAAAFTFVLDTAFSRFVDLIVKVIS
ncbi:MAG: preprotein translocase subunit SecE [Thermoleophilia bacterium]